VEGAVTAAYDLARTRRLLLLLSAAARAATRGRGVPLARAVELTGAKSERQVMDDVAALARLWADPATAEETVDLYLEDGEVHVTYGRTFGSPPAFSLAEGAVLLATLGAFEKAGGRAVKDASRKLRRAVPEVLRPEAERLARGLDVADAPPEPWASQLRDAIARRVEVVLDYRAVGDERASSEPVEGSGRSAAMADSAARPRAATVADSAARARTDLRRVVEPRLIFPREGVWYLAAWNVEKAAEHLFRLDRIAGVEVGTRSFDAHKGPPVGRYGKNHLYFESGAEREVTIRTRGAAARLARERHGARAEANADGTVSVRTRVTPGNYLFGVVLGHGGDATIEGPPDVVAAFEARVKELAARYG
jgi:proteasome accessory factor C